FLYFSPLFVQDRFDGLIAAVLRVDLLLRSISVPGEAPDFYLTLRENNQAIFSNLPAGSRELEEWRQSAMVTVKNSAWELSVIPSARALAVKNSPLPWLILGGGLVMTVLILISIQLAIGSRGAALALLESEKRHRILVDGVRDYAIYWLNPDGTVASWNVGAERLKGYRADEIIGKNFSAFYPEDDRARRLPQQICK